VRFRIQCLSLLTTLLLLASMTWVSSSVVAESRFFTASHKHGIGSCEGQLQLTDTSLIFASSTHPLNLRKSEIKRVDGDGIIDGAGKAWHFKISDRSPEDTHSLLMAWFNKIQPSESPSSPFGNGREIRKPTGNSQRTGVESGASSSEANDSAPIGSKSVSAGQQTTDQRTNSAASDVNDSVPNRAPQSALANATSKQLSF
jgi:hypothetical protein